MRKLNRDQRIEIKVLYTRLRAFTLRDLQGFRKEGQSWVKLRKRVLTTIAWKDTSWRKEMR